MQRRKAEKSTAKFNTTMSSLITLLSNDIEIYQNAVSQMQEQFKTENIPPILNSILFFRITFRDIVSLTKQVITAKEGFDKNVNSRSLALHLYEFLDDTQDFFGPKMKESIESIGFSDKDFLIKEMYRLKEYYKATKNAVFKNLAEVRHNTVAHKTQNSVLLNKMINDLSSNDIETSCLLIWILFYMVVGFQKNIINATFQLLQEKKLIEESNSNYLQNNNIKKRFEIDKEYKKIVLTMQGMEPEMAEVLCDVTPEALNKMIELAEHLQKKLG